MKTKTIFLEKPKTIFGIKKTCNQCEVLIINGLFCHETGCPNSKKKWVNGEWVKFVKCFECGFEVEEGTECNCFEPIENN